MERKSMKDQNVFCIFSLIIHLQLGVRAYQFCNIKRNVIRCRVYIHPPHRELMTALATPACNLI